MAHRRSSQHAKTIEEIRWGGANHVFLGFSSGIAAQTMITDGSKETLLRIRGEVMCTVDGAQAPGKLVEIAIAALVVQAGTGTTVIQSPLSDPDAPWLFYERFSLGYEEMVTDVIDVPGLSSFRKEVDNKAMRILRPGREVQLVFQNVTLNGGVTVNMSFGFRALLGKH